MKGVTLFVVYTASQKRAPLLPLFARLPIMKEVWASWYGRQSCNLRFKGAWLLLPGDFCVGARGARHSTSCSVSNVAHYRTPHRGSKRHLQCWYATQYEVKTVIWRLPHTKANLKNSGTTYLYNSDISEIKPYIAPRNHGDGVCISQA